MRYDNLNFVSQFDSSTVRDIKKINEELKNKNITKEELVKLENKRLYKAMQLNSASMNYYRRGIPY